jgi:DUF1707 SHOCT-like domain
MTTDRTMRASDQDRENVVEILRAQYAEGRLTLDEFDERMAAAYAGKTWGDLADLTSDLPVAAPLRTGMVTVPSQQPARGSCSPAARWFWPVVPLLIGVTILVSMPWNGMAFDRHHHYVPLFPVWLLVIFLVILRRATFARRGRRRGPF